MRVEARDWAANDLIVHLVLILSLSGPTGLCCSCHWKSWMHPQWHWRITSAGLAGWSTT